MQKGGLRIATVHGALLADPLGPGSLSEPAGESLFEPNYWAERRELVAVTGGRGAAWFIDSGTRQWALRHYRRGGLVARVSEDRYVWAGESRVRAFAEWRLLEVLSLRGLPVPKPVGARYRRAGLSYRCDLITERIVGADPLSVHMSSTSLSETAWLAIGRTIARLHRAGVDHADLNAHNILLDGGGRVSVIDFDRGRLRRPGRWAAHNVRRLRRSLEKISRTLPPGRFEASAWDSFLAGYGA